MTQWVTIKEFAQKVGVSIPMMTQAIQAGRLPNSVEVTKQGPRRNLYRIDLEVGLKEWHSNADKRGGKRGPGLDGTMQLGFQELLADVQAAAPPPEEPIRTKKQRQADKEKKESLAATYAESKAIKESYLAEMARLDLEERSGKLVSADAVKVLAAKTGRMVRDAILNVPGKLAGQLAGMEDPHAIEFLLLEYLTKAMESLPDAGKR
ncbi:hypothetical protein [Nostoc linckia]|uniref:hypothetical protein n=1 Tax=Nostoc linckia TaxID=92942 RepID=UPI000BFF95C5|nr:hypothetical protein [Nostoc linckia]